MLTFPCFVEEPWRARLAASLLRLRTPGLMMPANISVQAQSRFQAYARAAKPALSRSGPALAGILIRDGPITRIENSYEVNRQDHQLPPRSPAS
jgi:hypothetical protein